MLPGVAITKQDFSTGVVSPSEDGILTIIATSEKGAVDQPAAYTRQASAQTDFGNGPLVEFAAYDMAVAKKPVLLIRASGSVSGAYGSGTFTGTGSSVVTTAGTPLDDFDVVVKVLAGGTIGTPGITYQTSLDGGAQFGAVKALGNANTIAVTDGSGGTTGVTLNFAAGTLVAGDAFEVPTTRPKPTTSDVAAALEALRTTTQPWEIALIDGDATQSDVSQADLWLQAREAEGKFRHIIFNSRKKALGETEAAYDAALATVFASAASIRVSVCADGGDVTSLIRGISQFRPTSLGFAARAMAVDISVEPARVSDGPIAGYTITDPRGNPKYHNEALYPGLDDLRLVTLRSFDGRQGSYITNGNILSPAGSDYVYLPHARVMNKACEDAFQLLTERLSSGIRKDTSKVPNHILEDEAQEIEGHVQAQLDADFVTPKRVSAIKFVLSRSDDLTSNGPATLTATLNISALAYVKGFAVTSSFSRTIKVSAT